MVELGNFAAAASSLYITQSALGHRISSLEKELGLDLFVRGCGVRQVVLTDQGSRFIPIARQIAQLWDEALGLSAPQERPEVRIACVFSLQDLLVDPVMRALIAAGMRPYVASSNTLSAMRAVESGDLDFAVIGYGGIIDEGRCRVDVLATEQFVMVSQAESPYPETVSFKSLDPSKEIYSKWHTSVENWHRNAFGDGFVPPFTIEDLNQVEPLLTLDRAHWAVMPKGVALNGFAREGYKVSSFKERSPEREIRFISRLPIMAEGYDVLRRTLTDYLSSVDGFSVTA